jgi:hypothetical protein
MRPAGQGSRTPPVAARRGDVPVAAVSGNPAATNFVATIGDDSMEDHAALTGLAGKSAVLSGLFVSSAMRSSVGRRQSGMWSFSTHELTVDVGQPV